MEDQEFFGAVHFSTFVMLHHPDRTNDKPKHRRVNLGKVDCFYRDCPEVTARFIELNPHIPKKSIVAEFKFWTLVS